MKRIFPCNVQQARNVMENVWAEKQIRQNNARGREICVHQAAKMFHMWINVTVNCFL